MHELSIAQALMDIVQRHAGGRPVTRVEVRVGHLRQVVPAALDFAFELVARGTVAEGAELVLDAVPAAGRCRACGTVSQMEAFPLACAGCGSWDVEVIRGEELLLDTLELEEPLAMRTGGTGGGD